jgi:uncharacterized RDD family membrane protein YckC
MLDELYTVETPEQVDLAYDVAGVGSRALAALIDHLLVGIVIAVGVALLALLGNRLGLTSFLLIITLVVFGSLFVLCGYYVAFEVLWNGQTPGKRALGLRMVHVSGRPISFGASAVRNLLRLVDFLPAAYGVGFLVMFFDKRARRLGDMAAGAMAVRQRDALTLDSLMQPINRPVVRSVANITIPNLHALQRSDMDLVQSFVRRRAVLAPDARQRVAQQVLVPVQARLGYPITTEPEAFLVQLAAEYEALERER